jgi:hypothetical protein
MRQLIAIANTQVSSTIKMMDLAHEIEESSKQTLDDAKKMQRTTMNLVKKS